MFKLLYEEANPEGSTGGGAPNIVDPIVASTPAGQSVAGDPASKNWLEGLGDLGKDPSLQMFKDPASLAKSWVSAQKMIGADKVVIPGKDASEEEMAAFYAKIGRPESADKYEYKLPEGVQMDDNLAKSFKEVAYRAGLTARQAQALVEWDAQQKLENARGYQTKQETALKESLDAYKQSLGGEEKFKATVDKARVAVRALAPDDFKSFLRDSGVGSRPEAIAFFARLADMMGEDKIRDGTGVSFKNEDPSDIQREIDNLEKEMFSNVNSTSMASWVDRRAKLYERLNALRSSG